MAKYENYKLPIDACIYADDFSYKIGEMYDEAIMEAVLKVKVDVDKKELLKALEYDRGQYEMGYEQGYIDGKQKWIPVTKGLPNAQTEVIVSCLDDSGDTMYRYTASGWVTTDKEYWIVDNEINPFVIAWMPLPEPYKEENK